LIRRAAVDPMGISMLLGGGLGAVQGFMEQDAEKKQREAMMPKRKKLAAAQQGLAGIQQQRLAGMSMLAQAANSWADSLRY
jgi:hypothetical protein